MNERLLDVDRISVVFDQKPILNEFSLSIEAGQNTIIIGPSGSGKTTLLHSLAGLSTVDEGRVMLLGNYLDQLSDKMLSEMRSRYLGFVYQFHHLLIEFNVIDNIALSLMIQGLKQNMARTRAACLLEKMNVCSDLWKRSVSTLSGGERQRVALARAVVHRPKILFADEPTGCLDDENSTHLMNLLFDLHASYGTTIVMVSHDKNLTKYFHQTIELTDINAVKK